MYKLGFETYAGRAYYYGNLYYVGTAAETSVGIKGGNIIEQQTPSSPR